MLGIASIIKNYCIHESSVMNMILELDNLLKLKDIGIYQPGDKSTIFDTTRFLQSIYIDYDNDVPCIYDIPSCPIIELRGQTIRLNLKIEDINMLLDYTISDCAEKTLLNLLASSYQRHARQYPQRFRNKLFQFFTFKISEDKEIKKWRGEIKDNNQREIFDNDYKDLVRFTKAKRHSFEYVFFHCAVTYLLLF